ncbi:MAG: RsmD family RNA methyltransferase [Thermoanaerobaculaceae bacterium]
MRITGGVWASRRVLGPSRGLMLRPSPDALREQAFAILGEEIAGAAFLDLFAGTGVVSLEALSRGAAVAVLVEPNRKACELIRRNLAMFAVSPQQAQLLPTVAAKALEHLGKMGLVVDVVWADPPFADFHNHLSTLELLAQAPLLRPGGALVLECPPKACPKVEGFALERVLRGGLLLRRSRANQLPRAIEG